MVVHDKRRQLSVRHPVKPRRPVVVPHGRNPGVRCAHDTTEQQGEMGRFTGLVQAIRQLHAHRLVHDTNEADAIAWPLFASALFRVLSGVPQQLVPEPAPSPHQTV